MSILDWIGLLSELTESEKENFSLFCQEKILDEGEILFNESEEASAMYILLEWGIEISKSIKWEKKVIWKINAEEILWEMSLFTEDTTRMATATALEKCKLITILKFSINDIIAQHPELLEKITNIINNRKILNNNII